MKRKFLLIILTLLISVNVFCINNTYSAPSSTRDLVCYQRYGSTKYICTHRVDPKGGETKNVIFEQIKGGSLASMAGADPGTVSSYIKCTYTAAGASFRFAIEKKPVEFDSLSAPTVKHGFSSVSATGKIDEFYDDESKEGTYIADTSDISIKCVNSKVTSGTNDYVVFELTIKRILTTGYSLRANDGTNHVTLFKFYYDPDAEDPGISPDRTGTFDDDVLKDVNSYKPVDDIVGTPKTKIETMASKILTTITNVGMILSVLILAILGIKYMFGSIEEKAEYKQDLIPYIVGAGMLFGITALVKIFSAIGKTLNF